MQNDTHFDALTSVFELQYSKNGFIEGAFGLHYIVVHMINRRVDWDSCDQAGMVHLSPGIDNFRLCERAAVRQHLYGRFRKLIAALSKNINKFDPVGQRLPTCKRQGTRIFV